MAAMLVLSKVATTAGRTVVKMVVYLVGRWDKMTVESKVDWRVE